MNQQTIEEIVKEISSHLIGRFLGRTFQLSPLSLAIDFGLRDTGYLFISVDPAAPRVYLIERSSRQMEKRSITPSQFVQAMRRSLGGGRLLSVTKDVSERIVRLSFSVENELGESNCAALVAQLTGRSANLFLLDREGRITHALRSPKGAGQQLGQQYQAPAQDPPTAPRKLDIRNEQESPLEKGTFPSLSAAADDYYLRRESAAIFAARSKASLGKIKKELAQAIRLQSNLRKDLAAHGDSEQHKRYGDLLLANIANAKRDGNKIKLKDYYSEGAPEIEIEADENTSLQDEAARYFARYTKAKRATKEIGARRTQLAETITRLEERKAELERIFAARDETAFALFEGPGETQPAKKIKRKQSDKIPGVRRYRSSDGYEILVGRAAHTNDQLTFRIARPHDLWLHSADYPGSHVVIRNHRRSEIPHRTIIEAAQIAAKFSQAGDDSRVTVHYTQRKFLSKPKGAAPGLVRMSSFKTITVEPRESIERIETVQ
ncbi:MAG TPA: NFACT family protein [Pyrinomonadaceae bacterium]|nr:NFACT family protein [Pyrinomonadaceae bacterium]